MASAVTLRPASAGFFMPTFGWSMALVSYAEAVAIYGCRKTPITDREALAR